MLISFEDFGLTFIKKDRQNGERRKSRVLLEGNAHSTQSNSQVLHHQPALQKAKHRNYLRCVTYKDHTDGRVVDVLIIGVGDRGAGGAIALPFVKFGASCRKFWQLKIFFGQCLTV